MLTNPSGKLLNFDEFITEKLGVAKRMIYQEIDEFGISKIVNNFIDHIYKNPNKDYEVVESILDEIVEIKYLPKYVNKNAETTKGNIFIYKQINSDNYLNIKYILVHELLHIIQKNLSSDEYFEDMDTYDKLKYLLIKMTDSNMSHKGSKYFTYLVYRENLQEIFAWNQDAYGETFKLKLKCPKLTNKEIVNKVFKNIQMTKQDLKKAIIELKNDDYAFTCVINILVGHFFEIGKNNHQIYFDKDIFKLDIVKELRKEVKEITYNNPDLNDMCLRIIKLINEFKPRLKKIKSEIIDSFIKHMEYWFYEARKRIGKAIQLGIDDANTYKIK